MHVWDNYKVADHSWDVGDMLVEPDDFPFVFDFRPYVDSRRKHVIVDVALIKDHDGDLESLSKLLGVKSARRLEKAKDQLLAHSEAIRGAHVHLGGRSILELVPEEFFDRYRDLRVACIREIAETVSESELESYRLYTWPTALALHELEKNKVKLDVLRAKKIGDQKNSGTDANFARHMLGVSDNLGFMHQRLSPTGSKTLRFRNVSGLRSMAIPHGVCRELIVSRNPEGSIGSIDFNAIDFRCLVQAAGVEFYAGQRDFHSRTASLVGPVTSDLRDKIKKFTYTDLYGSSLATLQKQVQLPMRDIEQIFAKLDPVFRPIRQFRTQLVEECRQRKCLSVVDPFTAFVSSSEITGDMHAGQIVGLWAQTRSSFVFAHALRHAVGFCRGSKDMIPIFTVHDELNVDMGPDASLDELAGLIEQATGFVVTCQTGKNYSEATS